MITHDKHDAREPRVPTVELPATSETMPQLPLDATIQKIAFVAERNAEQEVLLEFPHAIQRFAELIQSDSDGQSAISAHDLLVLSVPSRPLKENETESEILSQVRAWVDAAPPANNPPSLMMTLQGARILWTPGRIAIISQPDRLATIGNALIEVSYYESELRDIERSLGQTWPQLEADMPLAFEFDEGSLNRRNQLRQRFQQVLLIRARLARIGPYVHCPHLHPPTLASQVAERLRERTRMVHRHEFLGEQIEVFERVYEMSGQRASDFFITRSSNTLQWVIIVLLVTQILLSAFELLTSTGL